MYVVKALGVILSQFPVLDVSDVRLEGVGDALLVDITVFYVIVSRQCYVGT